MIMQLITPLLCCLIDELQILFPPNCDFIWRFFKKEEKKRRRKKKVFIFPLKRSRATERERERERERAGGRAEERESMTEQLVPIRIDLEVDGKFLKDAFCWNAAESDDHLEDFAVGLCKDLKLPNTFVALVVDSMRQQISEFRVVEEKAKARMLQEPERLEVIRIKLRCGTTSIEDNFVWDIFNRSQNDPETFASVLCQDLKLDETKMAPLVAHKIREEVFNKKKEHFLQIQETAGGSRSSKKSRGSLSSSYASAALRSSQAATNKEYQKLLVNKVGIERSVEDQSNFGTIVTHLTEEEAKALDDQDEKRAVQVRQEAVAKKIEEIQQSKRAKHKQQQQQLQQQQQQQQSLAHGGFSLQDINNRLQAYGMPAPVGSQQKHSQQYRKSFPSSAVAAHSLHEKGAAQASGRPVSSLPYSNAVLHNSSMLAIPPSHRGGGSLHPNQAAQSPSQAAAFGGYDPITHSLDPLQPSPHGHQGHAGAVMGQSSMPLNISMYQQSQMNPATGLAGAHTNQQQQAAHYMNNQHLHAHAAQAHYHQQHTHAAQAQAQMYQQAAQSQMYQHAQPLTQMYQQHQQATQQVYHHPQVQVYHPPLSSQLQHPGAQSAAAGHLQMRSPMGSAPMGGALLSAASVSSGLTPMGGMAMGVNGVPMSGVPINRMAGSAMGGAAGLVSGTPMGRGVPMSHQQQQQQQEMYGSPVPFPPLYMMQ